MPETIRDKLVGMRLIKMFMNTRMPRQAPVISLQIEEFIANGLRVGQQPYTLPRRMLCALSHPKMMNWYTLSGTISL